MTNDELRAILEPIIKRAGKEASQAGMTPIQIGAAFVRIGTAMLCHEGLFRSPIFNIMETAFKNAEEMLKNER
jgi:hypothetical protein